jgi:hypothetical protein
MNLIDRFYKYLPDILDENTCWEWRGCLDSNDVIEIRRLYNIKKYTTIKLGEMYGIHRSTISYIVNNKTYTHLLEN